MLPITLTDLANWIDPGPEDTLQFVDRNWAQSFVQLVKEIVRAASLNLLEPIFHPPE
jgi:hypothetical protein